MIDLFKLIHQRMPKEDAKAMTNALCILIIAANDRRSMLQNNLDHNGYEEEKQAEVEIEVDAIERAIRLIENTH